MDGNLLQNCKITGCPGSLAVSALQCWRKCRTYFWWQMGITSKLYTQRISANYLSILVQIPVTVFTWTKYIFDPPSTVFCFICLLCLVAVFIHLSMHPFRQLSSLCSRPNPLNPAPRLIRSPLIPSILPSPGENLSIFNPAASSSASCHTGATAISKPNMVVSHRGLVDLPFNSSSTLSCLHSLVTHLALSLLFQKFDPEYLKSPAMDNSTPCNLILSV